MDVKTVEEPSRSSRSLANYLLLASGLVAAGVLPTFAAARLPTTAAAGLPTVVAPGDARLLTADVIVLLLGLVGRASIDEFATNRPGVSVETSLAGKVDG